MALTKSAVDTAIETILTTGQSVTIDGMTYSAANVKTLMELSEQMRTREMTSTRPTFRAVKFGSMGY